MKLYEIRLENFRQFYGEQVISISTDDQANVTLIHAENGFGKTTLLNALLWCFYGETTGKFENRDKLVNFEALNEGVNRAVVEVRFEHNKQTFMANRTITHSQRNRSSLKVFEIKKGEYKELSRDPAPFLNTVVPKEMAKYFFFDGEQAEAFSAETNNKEIGKAIKAMLGSDTAQTAIKDLEFCSKKYDEQIGLVPGNEEVTRHEKELSEHIAALERINDEMDQLTKENEMLDEQIGNLDRELLNIREVVNLQSEREELEHDLTSANTWSEELLRRRNKWFIRFAPQFLGGRLTTELSQYLNEVDVSGIPSPYNEEFVSSLLNSGKCICGASLKPGTKEYGCVAELLSDALSSIFQRKALQTKSFVSELSKNKVYAHSDYQDIERDRVDNENRIAEIEMRLSEIGDLLSEHDDPDISEKESARRKAVMRKESLNQELGLKQADVNRIKKLIEDKKEVINDLAKREIQLRPLVERREFCDLAAEMLGKVLEIYEEDARNKMQKEINDILEKTAHKDYQMEITEDFELELRFRDGTLTPKSGGENQLLSLAFMAALVGFAEERSLDENAILIPGAVAPLVLDSPFGQLDSKYRQATSAFLPEMASQVVLLASSSQASSDVISQIRDRVGEEYVLISENRGKKEKREISSIELYDSTYEVAEYGKDRNMTRIERVN